MKKLIGQYYYLFDQKLGNGTIVIFLITFLIILTGTFINTKKEIFYLKANIIEINK